LAACVLVEGRKLRLILDTGSPTTCFDKKRTERLKLTWKRGDLLPAREENSNLFDYWTVAEVCGLDFGTFKTRQMHVCAMDLTAHNRSFQENGDEPVDGVFGADVLFKYKGFIDYPSLRLYLKQQPGWFFPR
jgi:Aspartyl protease